MTQADVRPPADPAAALAWLAARKDGPGEAGGSPLGEPRAEPLTRWQRKILSRLAEGELVAWTDVAGPNGLRGPKHRHIRRFLRALEDGGAVHCDPYRMTFLPVDVAALARLLRWDGHGPLTAALRAGHVADSCAVVAGDASPAAAAQPSQAARGHASARAGRDPSYPDPAYASAAAGGDT